MDDAEVVGGGETFQQAPRQLAQLAPRERPLLEARRERGAVEEVHDEVVEPVGLVGVVDGEDVGMAQPGQGARLPHEPLGGGGGGPARLEHLDGDGPAQAGVPGGVHDPHAAGRDLGFHGIARRERGAQAVQQGLARHWGSRKDTAAAGEG